MTFHANDGFFKWKRIDKCIVLLFVWTVGTFIGCNLCSPYYLPLMRSAVIQPVSIVGLLFCIFLPLFVTYFSFLTNKLTIIFVVCFLKAVAFGFSGALIFSLYHGAGWMMSALFMFSDGIFTFALFLIWLRRFLHPDSSGMKALLVCTFFGLFVLLFDYFVISPFITGLF